jgi:hypothetical protein
MGLTSRLEALFQRAVSERDVKLYHTERSEIRAVRASFGPESCGTVERAEFPLRRADERPRGVHSRAKPRRGGLRVYRNPAGSWQPIARSLARVDVDIAQRRGCGSVPIPLNAQLQVEERVHSARSDHAIPIEIARRTADRLLPGAEDRFEIEDGVGKRDVVTVLVAVAAPFSTPLV